MAFWGTLAWLFTRKNVFLRLGILGVLMGLRLSSAEPGWIQKFWTTNPFPWLFAWDWLKYLFIIIPGTIAGERLLVLMKGQE